MGELPAFSRFCGTAIPLFEDSEHVGKLLNNALEHHVTFVAERGEERVGFILGCKMPHPFNPRIRTLSEQLWWVTEPYRGSRAGLLLLKAFVAWGEQNVDVISFGVEARSPVRDATLERHGFRLQERIFIREVR